MTLTSAPGTARARVTIRGAVQGMGFRPFIWRLATDLSLAGWVSNSAQGVEAEVEGAHLQLEKFLRRVSSECPRHSRILGLETAWLDPSGDRTFEIRASDPEGAPTALILPDIATCLDCLRDVFDPGNRRYLYPFTNCTECGPRFSIIEALPYDRANTSMKRFVMCVDCRAEYDDPRNRRFHAQPNACPACGPQLQLWDRAGRSLAERDHAIALAAEKLRQGAIVAVKGLGGFHLTVAAENDAAVRRLRHRKLREEKPFAVMFPSLAAARIECEISELEERLLHSSESPIVLLRRKRISELPNSPARVAASVAPGNPNLGVMLPYTPLHHVLLERIGTPLVATSGNRGDEPICIDEREAIQRLSGIADAFLIHDRPIVRLVDDSVVRVIAGRELVLRRGRGFAPLPVLIESAPCDSTNQASLRGRGPGELGTRCSSDAVQILAVGAHLKNAVAFTRGKQIFLSQHIGDLGTERAQEVFRGAIQDFQRLYKASPSLVAADLHPDYPSTRWAETSGLPTLSVQHHYAHALSCMAENAIWGPALGVVWDGTGYGPDGTLWGGEFLRIDDTGFERVGRLRSWRLPGGDTAIREPRRAALGLLYELFGEAAFELSDPRAFGPADKILASMLRCRFNSPLTSSAGRLFDVVASLAGLRHVSQFEGQAAMDLEFALDGVRSEEAYPLPAAQGLLDWGPMIEAIVVDLRARVPTALISARFHNGLVESIVALARQAGEPCVVLSGGCFQNKYLTERAVQRLREEGFHPYWHRRVPPNDGGIALGQAAAAVRWRAAKERSCA